MLILVGGYLYFQQWSHVRMKTQDYSYLSKSERNKRSIKAGFSAVIVVFGLFLIISTVAMTPVTLWSVSLFLLSAICTSPLVLLGTIYRMYKDLEPYTKMEDDVVFLDNKPEH